MTKAELARAFAAKLRESGLTPREARRLGIEPVRGEDTRQLAKHLDPRAGFVIRYPDPATGRPTKFWRYRYLEPVRGLAAAARKGGPKYVQPARSEPRVYHPPVAPWSKLLPDPDVALVLTEGELKALAATRAGFPTLGLGGVYAFRSAKRGRSFLPELEAIAWEGREVYVAFDSDAVRKPEVRGALTHLADELLARGAHVFEVVLPDLPDVGKTGLDDFLVARGPDAFEGLLDAAEEYAPGRALWGLSKEVAYVRDPGLVVEIATGVRWTPSAFRDHAYANRHYTERRAGRGGKTTLVKTPLAKAWLEWPHRAELGRITYAPGEPRITDDAAYNLWPGWGVAPAEGDVTPWRELVDFLFDGDRVRITWFERWAAYPLQHAGTKLLSAVILWGVAQGTGKSLLGYTLGRVYGDNFVEVGPAHLHDRYNDWAIGKQFVLGDEIAGGDRRADGDLVKRLITQQTVRINQKYLPTFTIPDRINYLFTSNHPDPFYIEPSDRRFFVSEVRARAPLPRAFYTRYDAWLRGDGPAALFERLLRVDLGGFDPNESALVTDDKSAMVAIGASDLDSWVLGLVADPVGVLGALDVTDPSDLWTAAQLRALYDPDDRRRVTTNGMARALRRAGVPAVGGAQGLTHTAHGLKKLYAVRDGERWARAAPRELAAHYHKHFPARPGGKF